MSVAGNIAHSDHAIGFSQSLDHLTDQHLDQRAMITGRRPNERLHDRTLDIDQGGNLLGILPVQVGQQAREVEVGITLARLGFKTGSCWIPGSWMCRWRTTRLLSPSPP